MDKYEYNLKVDQIKKLLKRKKYQAAAEIADTIDWRRVKNLDMLYTVGEVYEYTERYEDCMNVLNIAYDRAPVGRMLLYKMTDIATRMHNFDDAISLYREYVKVAPYDGSRYILKYQIYRERGSSLEDQIKILSEYKTQEYQEQWAYELAFLYAQAGMVEECVRECDELILWFSEGEYVVKALELKMQYEPLTAAQQEKYYRSRKTEEAYKEPEIQEFRTDEFSTINLQAELAENLGELLKEDATIEMPELELEKPSVEPLEEEPEHAITLDELELFDERIISEPSEEPEEIEIMLEELSFPEEKTVLEENTPQEIVPEEIVLEEIAPEEIALEEIAPKEIVPEENTSEEIVLEEIVPVEIVPEETVLEEIIPEKTVYEEVSHKETVYKEPEKEPEPDIVLDELELFDEVPVLQQSHEAPEDENVEEEDTEDEIEERISIDDLLAEWENKKAETEAILEAEAEQEQERKEKVKQETAELMKLISGISDAIPEDVQQILAEIDEEKALQEEVLETMDDLLPDLDDSEEAEEEEEIAVENLEEPEETVSAPVKSEKTTGLTNGNMIQELERSLSAEVSEMAVNAGHLTREQAKLFAYFTSVKGISKQLSVLFKDASEEQKTNSSSGNLVITGESGNGKTTLAIDIVKALQRTGRVKGKKLAKVSGQKLNKKDIYDVLLKLKGGALVIEKAGNLSDVSLMALSLAMETDTEGLLIILEDTAEEIQKLFLKNKNFASKFDYTVDIPVFTNDELVAFGKSYALELEYTFDEFGVLALYDKIGSRQTNDHMVTVAEVKDMIDEAIEHAEKGSVRHLFERLTKKRVNEFGHRLLREDDFT